MLKLAAFLLIAVSLQAFGENRKLIVLTDMEPDDRLALHVLFANVEPHEILMVGTGVMNAARKAALARRLFDQNGFEAVGVYQGTGGTAKSYPNLQATRPAREYTHEGQGILPPEQLARLAKAEVSSKKAQQALYENLSRNRDVEILLLSPPVDLVAVLKEHPELKANIKQIYVMGGWGESKGEGDKAILRTTYNWNMDPIGSHASAELVKMKDVPMTIFSYHAIKKAFPSRSINPGNFPKVFEAYGKAAGKVNSVAETKVVSKSWDGHALANLPPELPPTHLLKAALIEHGGNQFAPADSLAAVGMLRPELVLESRPVSIEIDESDIDQKTGIRVRVKEDATSKIRLVEAVDTSVLGEALFDGLDRTPAIVAHRMSAIERMKRLPSILCRRGYDYLAGL